MPQVLFPLAGDVRQVINPWNWFVQALGSQFGLVNISLGKSTDPTLEHQILEDVGSYGRQLGQMGDALETVLDHIETESWAPEAKEAIKAFRLQLAQVRRLKDKRKALRRQPGC